MRREERRVEHLSALRATRRRGSTKAVSAPNTDRHATSIEFAAYAARNAAFLNEKAPPETTDDCECEARYLYQQLLHIRPGADCPLNEPKKTRPAHEDEDANHQKESVHTAHVANRIGGMPHRIAIARFRK
jgi:hypothetical protein